MLQSAPQQQPMDPSKPVQMVIGGGAKQGDGPSRQETAALQAGIIDLRALEVDCKKIVQEISKRFIDLGLEDHEDDYAAEQFQAKQEKFEAEFKRLPFQFEAHSLALPNQDVHGGNEDEVLQNEDHKFNEEWAVLGQKIQDIHDILNMRALKQLEEIGQLILK